MNRRKFVKTVPAIALLAGTAPGYPVSILGRQNLHAILLPEPEKVGGKSILACLNERRTTRNISSKELPIQIISNLLWAGFGINRDTASFGKHGRTAPSASNSQEIDLYVALPSAVYVYEPVEHQLLPVVKGDYRSRSGRRSAASAPLNIFYVADLSKYDLGPSQPDRSIGDHEVQKSYYYTDTGFIAQNVYLFAASFGLAAWFHNCDKENTHKEFGLKSSQRILFAQTIGYQDI